MRAFAGWFLLALLVRGLTALAVAGPGFADAGYALHVTGGLLAGRGLTEEVVWNYLTPPPGLLPRPSNAYWPPGPAVFAAAGAALLPDTLPLWRRAQALPVLGAALLVAATYALALRAAPGAGARRRATTAAALVLGGGIYFPYWVTADSFVPFALTGGAVLWLAARAAGATAPTGRVLFAAGLLAGLAQAIRADGLLLLVAPLGVAAGRRSVSGLLLTLAGAAAGALPLVLRAVLTWGAPLPPGAGGALWLTAYDDLFRFAAPPDAARWLAAGAGAALGARTSALLANLAVLGQPVLYWALPLTVAGAWRSRGTALTRVALLYLLAIYLTMSLLFPFQGVRGGLFHSLVALVPAIALWTAQGLDAAVAWGAARRRWDAAQAQTVFAAALVGLTTVSGLTVGAGLIRRWDAQAASNAAAGAWLAAHTPPGTRLMAVDPTGLWYATGRSAVVVPSDGPDALRRAAAAYRVDYVLLQPFWPPYLVPVYDGAADLAGLEHLADAGALRIYRVDGAAAPPAGPGQTVTGAVSDSGSAASSPAAVAPSRG
jgi:hypothetical protein